MSKVSIEFTVEGYIDTLNKKREEVRKNLKNGSLSIIKDDLLDKAVDTIFDDAVEAIDKGFRKEPITEKDLWDLVTEPLMVTLVKGVKFKLMELTLEGLPKKEKEKNNAKSK